MEGEQEKLRSIMQGVQQLLPLLFGSISSNMARAVKDLCEHTCFSSPDAAKYLRHLQAAVKAMKTNTNVNKCMANLHASMVDLHEDTVQKVLEGCTMLQGKLCEGLGHVSQKLCALVTSMGELRGTVSIVASQSLKMLSTQDRMSETLLHISDQLQEISTRLPSPARAGPTSNSEVHCPPGGSTSTGFAIFANLSPASGELQPSKHERAGATSARSANMAVPLKITACPVLGMPLLLEGPMRPVALPCCGFVMSHAASQQLLARRLHTCHQCNAALTPGTVFKDSTDVHIAPEMLALIPSIWRSKDVKIIGRSKIGSGGEGRVVEGSIQFWGSTKRVAVKQIPQTCSTAARESTVAEVMQVVSTSYMAGVASPYVCPLHGFCWTDSELWLLMELCNGSLIDLVGKTRRNRRTAGLPSQDVVALGLMLCSALDAVHNRVRCLHLDITPGNILLAPPVTSGSGGINALISSAGEACSVRLVDFGLSKRLPVSEATSGKQSQQGVTGVAQGTPGYAPREQLKGVGQPRSDVYSLGATMVYAATGIHPYQGMSKEGKFTATMSGKRIHIPNSIEPLLLKVLIADMTSIEAHARPSLAKVQQRLLSIDADIRKQTHLPVVAKPSPSVGDQHKPVVARQKSDEAATCAHPRHSTDVAPASCKMESAQQQGKRTFLGLRGDIRNMFRKSFWSPCSLSSEGTPAVEAHPQPKHQAAAATDCRLRSGRAHAGTSDTSLAPAVSTAWGNREDSQSNIPSVHSTGDSTAPTADMAQQDASGIRTVEDLFARLSAGPPGRTFDFGGRTLPLTSDCQWSAASDSCTLTWKGQLAASAQVSQGGGVVANVTLALGDQGVLNVRGSSRVKFSGSVRIQGGRLCCSGPQCRTVLRDVTLDRCRLQVDCGATVKLHQGRALALPVTDDQWVCGVWGNGTTVHSDGTEFNGRITVFQGATFTGDRTDVRIGYKGRDGANLQTKLMSSIAVRGEGSHVTLRDSSIAAGTEPGLKGQAPGMHRVGVVTRHGAVVDLTGCTVKGVWTGIDLCSGSRACLRDCHVEAEADGVWVDGADTRVEAVDCRIKGCRADVATSKLVAFTSVTLKQCGGAGRRTFERRTTSKCTNRMFWL